MRTVFSIAACLAGLVSLAWAGHVHRLGPEPGWNHTSTDNYSYAILMDAGSTGTRLHVYRWVPSVTGEHLPANLSAPVEQGDSFKVKPGISDPADGGLTNLQTLIEDAKTKTVLSTMKDQWSEIPIMLFATGGMRILPQENRTSIMKQVRGILSGSGFNFALANQARIISGEEEGVFGWISANYHFGRLTDGPVMGLAHTLGALDLGGASTQVTFKPEHPSMLANSYEVLLGQQVDEHVYTHSFLYFGMNEATRRMQELCQLNGGGAATVECPCYYPGYSTEVTDLVSGTTSTLQGTGSFTGCRQLYVELFNQQALCLTDSKPTAPEHAPLGPLPVPINPDEGGASCSINGVYQPPVPGGASEFFAFSTFSYTFQFLGLQYNGTTPNDLAAATDKLCTTPWSEVQKQHPGTPVEYLEGYCSEASYEHALFTAAYGLPATSTAVVVADPDAAFQADWTLGAMFTIANKPWLLR